jgi:hypothetical protein
MVNLGKTPLPPNRHYHRPLNYPKYVKDFDPNAHVRVFKTSIRANNETMMQKLLIYIILPSKILCLIGVTIIWEIT